MENEATIGETAETKKAFWIRTLTTWQKSGLSGSEFQRLNNLSKNAFVYWKKKLIPRTETEQRLVPVRVQMSGASYGIRLHVGELYTVDLMHRFDSQSLRQLLVVLQEMV